MYNRLTDLFRGDKYGGRGGPMRRNLLFALILNMVFLIGSQVLADPEGCSVCGMDVSKYTHVKYVVTETDGKTHTTCGVQCGLTLQTRLGDKFRSAMATDLITHREVEASKAFYVYKSSVITDMAPGFIAFSTKEKAQKFAKGFGGKLVTYQEALEIWKKQMR
jgi:nitrous oxide reductase accessory protein NosL